jgi:hypothetical protein
MNFLEWSKSSVDYGRRLVDSAVEGGRSGEDEFLHDAPLVPYLGESCRRAVAPAVVGACLGILGSYLASRRRSTARVLSDGLLGGVIGFGAGMIWENRQFTASVASGAWKGIGKTRDEHLFEKNPIDYA